MNQANIDSLNKKLIRLILSFPFPFMDILHEQVSASTISNEVYKDCYTILFEKKENVRLLPNWLPTVPQGCQILKESGPFSCQLYIESGHIVQFEVVDMGLNELDWDYFWTHKPIYDVEYDTTRIYSCLKGIEASISRFRIGDDYALIEVNTQAGHHTICLWDCDIRAFQIPPDPYFCRFDILQNFQSKRQFILKSDDKLVEIECSLICLQDCLHIG